MLGFHGIHPKDMELIQLAQSLQQAHGMMAFHADGGVQTFVPGMRMTRARILIRHAVHARLVSKELQQCADYRWLDTNVTRTFSKHSVTGQNRLRSCIFQMRERDTFGFKMETPLQMSILSYTEIV